MNNSTLLQELIGQTDIYLVDQILKGRYRHTDIVLDAGCGSGRNLQWFVQNNVEIFGTDQDAGAIQNLREKFPVEIAGRFLCAAVESLPFEANAFDHIISSAVLHFARNVDHFQNMVAEMVRVLRARGSLFIRMASDIGIEKSVEPVGNGVYQIPDGSRRFLLTRSLLSETLKNHRLSFLEPFKTTNVNDLRCMSTLIIVKQ